MSDVLAQLAARVAAAEASDARRLRRASWQYLSIVAAVIIVASLMAFG